MPRFDGTGPTGEGPMTGGGRGYCNPAGRNYVYGVPRFGRGRGFRGARGGRGFGRMDGYGPGWGWYAPAYGAPYGNPYPMNPADEINMLRDEANAMKSELDAINKRIEELETSSQVS